jgi:hypothetical protein
MATKISDLSVFSGKVPLKNGLLACGLYSAVFYIITDLLASWWYTGYSIIDQNYSELLATGAPTRQGMLFVSVVYNILVTAFAIGIWTSYDLKRTSKITGALMIGYAIISMVTPTFFQMDMRGAQITPLGSLHPIMTAVMSLFILLSIGFGAFLLSKQFRVYSFITIVLLILFGFITSLQAPQLSLGQPTPLMGFTERINIYSTMVWFAILSVALLRAEKNRKRLNLTDSD